MGGLAMSDRNRLKSNGGFTVIEVMVTIAILAMVGCTLILLIIHSLKSWSDGYNKNDATANSAVLFHKLYIDVREGSGAIGAKNELRLSMPPIITDTYGEDYYDLAATPTVYRYYLENGKVYQKIGSDPARSFAAYDSENEITFSVTGSIVTVNIHKKDHPEEIIDTYQILMRNFQGQD